MSLGQPSLARSLGRSLTLAAALLASSFASAAWAQQQMQQMQQMQMQTHLHGRLTLDLAVDGSSIVITLASPLDNLVGFERVPATAAERKAAVEAIAKLRETEDLFRIDEAAGCKPGPIDLRSAALGLGGPSMDGRYGAPSELQAEEEHADLGATFVFHCTRAAAARFIDLAFFTGFRNLQQIDVQIAAPQGQFKRTLKRPNMRLAWGK